MFPHSTFHILMKRLSLVALLLALTPLALVGCDSNDTANVQVYTGTFAALNGSGVSGDARITIDNDTDMLTVEIDGQDLDPSIVHVQHIHAAAACPTATADVNSDGFVDVVEGLPTYGAILLPLDSDLSNQTNETFPTASSSGTVTYESSTPYTDLVATLRASTATSPLTGLAANENLDVNTRTIVLHGVDISTALPGTVATIAGLPSQTTLPVACATLTLDN